MTAPRIPATGLQRIENLLDPVDRDLNRDYPGDKVGGQPAHTVYLSAADADSRMPREWGNSALALLSEHRSTIDALDTADSIPRVVAKLHKQPIQDLRFDFEDGYGWRSDEREDADARKVGAVLAELSLDSSGPSSLGVRTKGLAAYERRRGFRTLELVLDAAGGVPAGFVFTVPKLRAAEQVPAVVALCEEVEHAHGIPSGSLKFELQIESPQAVIGADGTATLARALHLADGRCSGLHYGTYDYSAACGITSAYQSLAHPVADHAKAVMLAAAAQTGVWVCDGSTQVMPVGDRSTIGDAIERHFGLVSRSLERGFYQGWDMHPGHLATRWLATYTFFRRALPTAAVRLQAYLDRQGGGVVDEPATAQALAGVLIRGLDADAFDEIELLGLAPGVSVSVLADVLTRRITFGE